MQSQDVAAIAASISAFGAVTTAGIAAYSLIGSRQDSRNRTRPVLVARLKSENLSKGTGLLHIRNYGATSAREVRVAFDPPLADPAGLPNSDNWKWVGMRYKDRIPNWPPGMTLANIVKSGNADQMNPFTVKIAYKGLDGRAYHDHFHLDYNLIGTETWAGLSDSESFEKKASRALNVIARSIDRELG